MSTKRWLLWDFDGTLGYRPGMWSQALVDVLREHYPACPATREDIRPFLQSGFPWHQAHIPHPEWTTPEQWWAEIEALITCAYLGVGCSPSVARQLAPLAHRKYVEKSQWLVYEDVVPALQALTDLGWEHAILSNHVPELAEIVDAIGLTPYVRVIFSSAWIGYEKPHPQAFQHVLSALNHPQTVWMVGDNITADVLGAQAIGIPAILVRKEDTRATHAFSDLSLLVTFFSQERTLPE